MIIQGARARRGLVHAPPPVAVVVVPPWAPSAAGKTRSRSPGRPHASRHSLRSLRSDATRSTVLGGLRFFWPFRLHENVTEARSRAVSASGPEAQAEAESGLGGALRQLFAVAESYPELKADRNFRELQRELTDTEDGIQSARQSYNESEPLRPSPGRSSDGRSRAH